MKRKLAVILAICLCVALCACGASDESDKADKSMLVIEKESTDSEETSADNKEVNTDSENVSFETEEPQDITTDPTTSDAEQDLNIVVRALKNETLQYPSQNDEWKYDVYESYISIKEYIGNASIVAIPSEIDGLPVKIIESTFRDSNAFDEITIPGSVVCVRIIAFSGLPVKKVLFTSDDPIVFENGVFQHCTMLEDMDAIVNHIYGNKIPDELFSAQYEVTRDKYKYYQNLDEVLVLPENIAMIGKEAFCGQNLKSINLENITNIGDSAFLGCGFQEVDLSALTTIGKRAFMGCTSLKEIVLYNVTDIPEGTFDNCKPQLIDIGNAQTIGEDALPRTLPTLIIRNPSCEIEASAFGYLVGEMTIYGLAGSSAAKFASDYDCIFKIIE